MSKTEENSTLSLKNILEDTELCQSFEDAFSYEDLLAFFMIFVGLLYAVYVCDRYFGVQHEHVQHIDEVENLI